MYELTKKMIGMGVTVVGGCCGLGPEYIAPVCQAFKEK